jgi:hypothetical protein
MSSPAELRMERMRKKAAILNYTEFKIDRSFNDDNKDIIGPFYPNSNVPNDKYAIEFFIAISFLDPTSDLITYLERNFLSFTGDKVALLKYLKNNIVRYKLGGDYFEFDPGIMKAAVLAWIVEAQKKIELENINNIDESFAHLKLSRKQTSILFSELRNLKVIKCDLDNSKLANAIKILTGFSDKTVRHEVSGTGVEVIESKKNLAAIADMLTELQTRISSRMNNII